MRKIENLTIGDYIKIIRRRVWYVIVTATLVSVGTALYVWQMPSIYTSETTIVVTNRLIPENYIPSLERETPASRIEFVRQQLQSRTFLTRIVQEFQMTGPEPEQIENAARAIGGSIAILPLTTSAFKVSFSATEPTLAQSVTSRLAEAVIQLNDAYRKEKVHSADQYLEDASREAAANLAQMEEKVWQFNRQHFPGLPQAGLNAQALQELRAELTNLETRLQNALTERTNIGQRMAEQQQLSDVVGAFALPVEPLKEAPQAAAAAVAAAAVSPLETSLAVKRQELAAAAIRYTSIHPEVVRLNLEVNELERQVSQFRAQNPPPEPLQRPDPKPASPSNSVPATALVMPEVNVSLNLMQAELRLKLNTVNSEIAQSEQTKKNLLGRIAIFDLRLNPPPEIAQQLAVLERDYESAQQRFKLLSEKKLTSEMALKVDANDENETFKVIDRASLPQKPAWPNRTLLSLAGCVAGLGFGIVLAFAREFVDSSMYDEGEATAELALPILAGIPTVTSGVEEDGRSRWSRGDERKKHPAILGSSSEGESEPVHTAEFSLQNANSKIRDVILNSVNVAGEHYLLMHAKLSRLQKERGVKTILITSALPEEGKTFAACCMAGVLAREPGKKVLLIDADLRRGSASDALGVKQDSVGLADLLSGGELGSEVQYRAKYSDHVVLPDSYSLEQSMLRCSDVNLYFLPAGRSADSAMLLNTPELERLIRDAERLFDWVIIDSPPVLPVADANLLIPICDATLFVVAAGKTPAAVAKEAIQRVGPERICGLLMNRLRPNNSNYYRSYYSRPNRPKQLQT